MSELKATTAQEIVRNEKDCDYMDELFGGVKMPPAQVYIKSEADKYIQELEEKRFNDLQDAEDSFKSILELNHKEIRHHKYKRCLDNAEICCEKKENCYNRALRKYSKDEADYLVRKSDFWQDWEFRWLELAEKFKEAK